MNQRYMVGLGVTGVVVVGASLALLMYGKMAAKARLLTQGAWPTTAPYHHQAQLQDGDR
jgi:hypothetical protein